MKNTSTAHRQIQLEVAISNGTLTAEQIHNKLLIEIAIELNHPPEEVNMEYVNACETLLALLNHDKEGTLPSHYVSNLAAIHRKLQYHHKKIRTVHQWRYVAACCVMVIVLFAGVLIPTDRILILQTPDQGQLIMQGVENPSGYGGIADAGPAFTHLGLHDTTDWYEAISLMGGIPAVPQWMPTGWSINMYSLDLTDSFSRLSITYCDKSRDELLVYEVCTYFKLDDMLIAIEQDQAGTSVQLSDGTNVYIVSNAEHNSAMWYDRQTDYLLTGPVTSTDLVRIVESIQ